MPGPNADSDCVGRRFREFNSFGGPPGLYELWGQPLALPAIVPVAVA